MGAPAQKGLPNPHPKPKIQDFLDKKNDYAVAKSLKIRSIGMKNKIKYILFAGLLLWISLFGGNYITGTCAACPDQNYSRCHWKSPLELTVETVLLSRGTDSGPRGGLFYQPGKTDACCKGSEWRFEREIAFRPPHPNLQAPPLVLAFNLSRPPDKDRVSQPVFSRYKEIPSVPIYTRVVSFLC